MKHLIIILSFVLGFAGTQAQTSVSIMAPQGLLDSSVTSITIKDVRQLLGQACGCTVTVNDKTAKVILQLPVINKDSAALLSHFAQQATYPYRNYPEHHYNWSINQSGDRIVYQLQATSLQGVSFGLYGLLQEHLGFRFYHPRQTIIPHWANGWPDEASHSFTGAPLFDKKGFHLHTQHPLELTEQLLDPTAPNASGDIKQYIDWLVRNGQNYFEFCLLNSIDKKIWPAHAKQFVDYAHSRGILAGADISLHMIQQKAFELYGGPFNQKKQIEKNLTWLLQANWDYLSMEFSTAEFIAGNTGKKEQLRQYIISWLLQHSQTKLTGRVHVVKQVNDESAKHAMVPVDSAALALDRQRGVLVHTVMFYDMTEQNAPVYENRNQRHQFEFLKQQLKQRETWYYPESAYWITFDNSIPMFLLPYLSARLSDIDTCEKYGVPGHLTFSSGWEWGYWLFDWSIARWSWQYTSDEIKETRTPAMYAGQISNTPGAAVMMEEELALQQKYLKDSTLMPWMTATTITDEINFKALNKAYEPRPAWSYKFLENKAGDSVITLLRKETIPRLRRFAENALQTEARFNKRGPDSISAEWTDGLAITGLRAMHRYYTLQYILARREASLHHRRFEGDTLLQQAASIRRQAQEIVTRRQQHYRYPVSSVATNHKTHTSYHYGYLYMASNLHFWEREEEQALRNNYHPFFMNVWDIWRIAGIIK